ncbi:MAG TPA: tetratricopeptide repeat protein [Ktedonobacteraceae bacterium]|nr:tetratricopeptide repeat protein [Ktedonobacteraceae bacterium]
MQRYPRDAGLYNNLGVLLANMKHDEQAIRAYEQAIELEPGEVLFYRNLSILLEQLGRGQEAEQLQLRAESAGLQWEETPNPDAPIPEERTIRWEHLPTVHYPMPAILKDLRH